MPVSYAGVSIDNTGVIKLGSTGSLATSTVTTRLSGNNSLGDLVWKDDNRNSTKDGSEAGLANVTVSLYFDAVWKDDNRNSAKDVSEAGLANVTVSLYLDANSNGVVDVSEPRYATTLTNPSGLYSFSSLIDGNYVVVVDGDDSDITAGYSLPNAVLSAIPVSLDPLRTNPAAVAVLTADWPFIPALEIVKSVTPATYGEGDLITYQIDLENHAAPVPAATPALQTVSASGATAKNPEKQLPANIVGPPNGTYGSLDWRANSDQLTTSGAFTLNPSTGVISKVELLLRCYTTRPFGDDNVTLSLGVSAAAPAAFAPGGVVPLSVATLNTMVGVPRDLVVDITTKVTGTWSIAQVQSNRHLDHRAGSIAGGGFAGQQNRQSRRQPVLSG